MGLPQFRVFCGHLHISADSIWLSSSPSLRTLAPLGHQVYSLCGRVSYADNHLGCRWHSRSSSRPMQPMASVTNCCGMSLLQFRRTGTRLLSLLTIILTAGGTPAILAGCCSFRVIRTSCGLSSMMEWACRSFSVIADICLLLARVDFRRGRVRLGNALGCRSSLCIGDDFWFASCWLELIFVVDAFVSEKLLVVAGTPAI
jgi:hypothetical protein